MAATRTKRLATTALAATTAALLLGTALAHGASAADLPHAPVAYLATGTDLTGSQQPVDTDCQNLTDPARSAVNLTDHDLRIYFAADCQSGLPGQPGDLAFALPSLHWGNLPHPALSYRVVR
jgi:hypothetical protein